MLASNMDCNQKSKEDILSCMQSKSLEEIYSASDLGFSNAPYEGPLIWASVVDGDFVSDPFFPQEAQCSKNGKILLLMSLENFFDTTELSYLC